MAIFNSYVKLPEGISHLLIYLSGIKTCQNLPKSIPEALADSSKWPCARRGRFFGRLSEGGTHHETNGDRWRYG